MLFSEGWHHILEYETHCDLSISCHSVKWHVPSSVFVNSFINWSFWFCTTISRQILQVWLLSQNDACQLTNCPPPFISVPSCRRVMEWLLPCFLRWILSFTLWMVRLCAICQFDLCIWPLVFSSLVNYFNDFIGTIVFLF